MPGGGKVGPTGAPAYHAPPLPGAKIKPGEPVDLGRLPEVHVGDLYPPAMGAHPSGETAAAWRARMAENMRAASVDEVKAVRAFTGDHYSLIRAVEAGVAGDDLHKLGLDPQHEAGARRWSDGIASGIRASRPEPGTCFRGMDDVPAEAIQAMLARSGPFGLGAGGVGATASATWSRDVAIDKFMKGDRDPVFGDRYRVLFVVQGKTQVGVAHVSHHADEQELMFSRDARFRVTSVARQEGTKRVLIIELEEVDPS